MGKLSRLAQKEQDRSIGNALRDHGVSNRHAASKLRVSSSLHVGTHQALNRGKNDVCPKQGIGDNGLGFHTVTS